MSEQNNQHVHATRGLGALLWLHMSYDTGVHDRCPSGGSTGQRLKRGSRFSAAADLPNTQRQADKQSAFCRQEHGIFLGHADAASHQVCMVYECRHAVIEQDPVAAKKIGSLAVLETGSWTSRRRPSRLRLLAH